MNPRRRITLERHFVASLDEVWALWTTRDGIESWWGPDGFAVRVLKLELEPGGQLRYQMTATAPQQVQFMKRANLPLTTLATVTYCEVTPPTRLSYVHLADFIPSVEPYDVQTVVELSPAGTGVRMVLTFDAMHDELWTQRAVMGWDSQLGRLAALIHPSPPPGVPR